MWVVVALQVELLVWSAIVVLLELAGVPIAPGAIVQTELLLAVEKTFVADLHFEVASLADALAGCEWLEAVDEFWVGWAA